MKSKKKAPESATFVEVVSPSRDGWITEKCPINWCDFCCLTGDKCEVHTTHILPRRCPLRKGPVVLNATKEKPTV